MFNKSCLFFFCKVEEKVQSVKLAKKAHIATNEHIFTNSLCYERSLIKYQFLQSLQPSLYWNITLNNFLIWLTITIHLLDLMIMANFNFMWGMKLPNSIKILITMHLSISHILFLHSYIDDHRYLTFLQCRIQMKNSNFNFVLL